MYKLTEAERDLIIKNRAQRRPAAERTGFIGVVNFYNGPRGGRYRGIRTPVLATLDEAVAGAEKIAARRYNVPVREIDVREIDVHGEVVA